MFLVAELDPVCVSIFVLFCGQTLKKSVMFKDIYACALGIGSRVTGQIEGVLVQSWFLYME